MNLVALKMLIGDRAKYYGIVLGISFASLLITQQAAIFTGLMARSYGTVTALGLADIWVADPEVQFIDDIKPIQDTQVYRVRSVAGVQWAMPLYRGLIRARLSNGRFQSCFMIGLDDATLTGGPPEMVEGHLADLHRADSVIVDVVGANGKLAKPPKSPGEKPVPLKVGDTLELNDHRATVVGICKVLRTFQSQPVVYTTYSRATTFAPQERKLLTFVLVKAKPGQDLKELCARIDRNTGLKAYTKDAFQDLTLWYYMKYTGIPVNFGVAVVLGFLVGTIIAGQTFYNFTQDNLRQFGTLKAMGASNKLLLRMILLQALLVGWIGYGLGVGGASLLGKMLANTELAFKMPWQLLWVTAGAVTVISALAALISIRKVMTLEPAIVFKT